MEPVKVVGFFNPSGVFPSWVTPLLNVDGTLSVFDETSADSTASSPFRAVSAKDKSKCAFISEREIEPPFLCYALNKDEVILGDERKIAAELQRLIADGRFRELPEAERDAALFVAERANLFGRPGDPKAIQGCLSKERASAICNHVFSLTMDVCSTVGIQMGSILPHEKQTLSVGLRTFADTTVLRIHNQDWGVSPYPSRAVAQQMPLFMPMFTEMAEAQRDLSWASWLYTARPGQYAVVFNKKAIAQTLARTGKSGEDLYTKLFLHELGHLVLHREVLFPSRGKHLRFAVDSSATMAAEAWLFVSTILGLALGEKAYHSKVSNYLDDAWKFI